MPFLQHQSHEVRPQKPNTLRSFPSVSTHGEDKESQPRSGQLTPVTRIEIIVDFLLVSLFLQRPHDNFSFVKDLAQQFFMVVSNY